MNILNIGILAHVDAGKTSLTERLLYNAGVIKTLGSVDKGNTQTDSMALERQRGITIKAAVVSFDLDDLKINVIDTPGHPDFIAEVERSLSILDAAVLVISAVEGIQPQTRILMRTLQKRHIPTVIFVNKIDRMGARTTDLVDEIEVRLGVALLVVNSVVDVGTRRVATTMIGPDASGFAGRCPVVFGSAITGAGIYELAQVLTALSAPRAENDELSAKIFKLERGRHNEKIAYVRVYSGRLGVGFLDAGIAKITAMQQFKQGKMIPVRIAEAGDIVKVWGLHDSRVGDYIGRRPEHEVSGDLRRPGLEVGVTVDVAADRPRLFNALQQLSEQDPLLEVHQDGQGALSVRLYGEVQREIIAELLRADYGLAVTFEKTKIIYQEKVSGAGASYAEKFAPDNFFVATLGIRIRLGNPDSGVVFVPDTGVGRIPVSYMKVVEEAVHRTLQQGLYGWAVTDAVIEVTAAGYESAMSTGTDFRRLTPLLVVEALQKAGTQVYEPVSRFELEAPDATLPAVLQRLAQAEAIPGDITKLDAGVTRIKGTMPVRRSFDFGREVPNLTQGEGTYIAEYGGHQPVPGLAPTRPRTDDNPLNKEEYLRHVLGRQ